MNHLGEAVPFIMAVGTLVTAFTGLVSAVQGFRRKADPGAKPSKAEAFLDRMSYVARGKFRNGK